MLKAVFKDTEKIGSLLKIIAVSRPWYAYAAADGKGENFKTSKDAIAWLIAQHDLDLMISTQEHPMPQAQKLHDKIIRSYLFTLNKGGASESNLSAKEVDLILLALKHLAAQPS